MVSTRAAARAAKIDEVRRVRHEGETPLGGEGFRRASARVHIGGSAIDAREERLALLDGAPGHLGRTRRLERRYTLEPESTREFSHLLDADRLEQRCQHDERTNERGERLVQFVRP